MMPARVRAIQAVLASIPVRRHSTAAAARLLASMTEPLPMLAVRERPRRGARRHRRGVEARRDSHLMAVARDSRRTGVRHDSNRTARLDLRQAMLMASMLSSAQARMPFAPAVPVLSAAAVPLALVQVPTMSFVPAVSRVASLSSALVPLPSSMQTQLASSVRVPLVVPVMLVGLAVRAEGLHAATSATMCSGSAPAVWAHRYEQAASPSRHDGSE
jgi:hypothetical protein